MAKKTESTAVNDLLNLMANEGPRVVDPSADLFAEPPKKMPKGASGMFSMTAPPPPPTKGTRMSGKVAAVQSAGSVDPLPRKRAPLGTQSNTIPAPSRMSTVVPSRDNTIPALEAAPPGPLDVRASRPGLPVPSRTMTPAPPPPARKSLAMPVVAPPVPAALPNFEVDVDIDEAPMSAKPVAAPAVAPAAVDMTSSAPWFADSKAIPTQTPFENTSKLHQSRSATRDLMKKLALPTVAMIVLGGAIGGYIAISKKTTKAAPATVALAAPVEAKPVEAVEAPVETPAQNIAAPVENKIETPAPVVAKPTLVDVRIDSTPSGAEVTLVDHGKSTFLGSTPISASVDPSHQYEVMFSYPNKPSKIEKLDPKTTQHLAVSLGKEAPVETAKPIAVVAPKQRVEAVAPKTEVAADKPAKVEKTEPKVEKTEAKVEKTEPKTEKVAAASESGEGVLMIGSKPPCEITVDGKATGLMTPQRAMTLSVGKHTIKLASPDGEHTKTLTVDIKADKPTKVIEDLLGL